MALKLEKKSRNCFNVYLYSLSDSSARSSEGELKRAYRRCQWRFWGLHLGGSGVAIIAAGGTDLYCHSEPPLTSGKLSLS